MKIGGCTVNKKAFLAVALLILSIILIAIIVGRWTLVRAPDLTKERLESTQEPVAAVNAVKLKADNGDLVAPFKPTEPVYMTAEPTPMPASEIPMITPREEIPFTPQPVQGRYGSDYLSADEIETLARLIYLEARGEPFSGQQAVAEVVLNRVLSPLFPGNVYDVVYQSDPVQFTPAAEIPYTTPTQTQYDAVAAALTGPNILPQQVLYFAVGQNGRTNVWGWIGGHCFCY